MPDSPWRLDGQHATLAWHGLQAQLDLTRPDLGLRCEKWNHAALGSLALLGIVFPEVAAASSACDAYTRGLDLIATFADTPERPFRVQAYWRCIAAPVEVDVPAVAIEMQLSVQTPLLDCTPVVHSRSMFNGVAALQRARLSSDVSQTARSVDDDAVTSGGEVFSAQVSSEPQPIQYVEMVHASDLQSNRVQRTAEGWTLEHDLFEPGLEKGVIRRVRVRGLFYAGAADDQFVEHAFHAFHHTALPLTT